MVKRSSSMRPRSPLVEGLSRVWFMSHRTEASERPVFRRLAGAHSSEEMVMQWLAQSRRVGLA